MVLTRGWVVRHIRPASYMGCPLLGKFKAELAQGPDHLDAHDTPWQIEALLSADISAPVGGSLEGAAGLVRAKGLVIVNRRDQFVNPQPAAQFAALL